MAWEQAATISTTIVGIMAGYIIHRLNKIEDKLDVKVDEKECVERRENCPARNGVARAADQDKDLWDALHKHTHEGIPGSGRVIRG